MRKCWNCKNEIKETDQTCPKCHQDQNPITILPMGKQSIRTYRYLRNLPDLVRDRVSNYFENIISQHDSALNGLIDELSRRIEHLEKDGRIDEDYLKSGLLEETFIDIIANISKTYYPVKVDCLKNLGQTIISNSLDIASEGVSKDRLNHYISIIEVFSPTHLIILKNLASKFLPKDNNGQFLISVQAKKPTVGFSINRKQAYEAILYDGEVDIARDVFDGIFEHFKNRGLTVIGEYDENVDDFVFHKDQDVDTRLYSLVEHGVLFCKYAFDMPIVIKKESV